jgi:N-methylhydantoinase B
MPDPITIELIQTRLTSIVREMRTIVIRTAYSPMITEGHDFSSAVLSPRGELVAASQLEQPTHISALSWSAGEVIGKYGADIAPGDLFLHNDPYTGGSHLNDVGLFHPVFLEGKLLAFIAVMAHWQDVGGMVPGSLSGTATEIFQEGIRVPAIRIARGGELTPEVMQLLLANVRQPEDRLGDLRAQEGACRVAERRLLAMARRWGEATIAEALEALLERAEARMRAAIGQLPDGVYHYETYLDNSGPSPEPLRLRLSLTVAGEEIHADFTGCAPQVLGPTNLGPAPATTATFTMTKALLDPGGPINAGALRPLRVTAPEGSVVNARPPAACGAIGEVRRALESLVVGTLGKAIPERRVGDLKGASNIISIGGPHPARGEAFLYAEFPAGGTGGFAGADGNNTMRNYAEGDISSLQPIEAVELTCPLRVEATVLRQDSGGAGARRGGLGMERHVRLLAPEGRLSVLSDRNLIPPYGVRGGGNGAPNRFTVRRDGKELQPSPLPGKVTNFSLREGDVLVIRTAGGGGYGPPLQRDPAAVARDVEYGYCSAEAAQDSYGVVLSNGGIDAAATEAVRASLQFRRTEATVGLLEVAGDGDGPAEYRGARRRAVVDPETARHLGAEPGTMVELPAPAGPSLLAWLEVDDALPPGSCRLGASGLAILGVAPQARIELRPLVTPP